MKDGVARKEARRRVAYTEITVDVTAFAHAFRITNPIWIREIRQGVRAAQMGESDPSTWTTGVRPSTQWCKALGYRLGQHLTAQPEWEIGMKVMRATPRVRK